MTAAACEAGAEDPTSAFDAEVVDRLQTVVDDGVEGSAGGMVARIDTPDEELVLAVGEANIATGKKLTGDEAFLIGSITKLFTATVALQLVEEGRLRLDEPIAEVVPNQAARFEHGEEITLRHLLRHTSGLPDYLGVPGYIADRFANVSIDDESPAAVVSAPCPDERDWLAYAADQGARFRPGTGSDYSNTNYVLVGRMIEAVTGRPLAEAYRERIFRPLGMRDTWLSCVAERPRAEVAHGYADTRLFNRIPADIAAGIGNITTDVLDMTDFSRTLAWADGGLASTSEDLAVFARALFTGELFDDDATLKAMLKPGPLGFAPGVRYGLGVVVEGDAMGHGGDIFGYHSLLQYHPATDTVVVVWRNLPPTQQAHTVAEVGTQIMDIVVQAAQ